MSDTSKKFTGVIHWLFYILFFLTPLLLWPFTSEVFEFNKMMFVYLMTVIISSVWLFKTFSEKKFTIAKTPLDIPIFLFLLSQIISTIISINHHTSLWGYYSRFHGGLISTVSYITLYYAFVTHFAHEKKALFNIIIAILSSAAIISFYAILERLGIDKNIWVQDVQSRVFSTLGQPNWLSAFLVALLPLSLFRATKPEANLNQRFLYSSLSVLYLIAIAFTRSQSGIGATAVIVLLFFIIISIQYKKSWLILSLLPLTILMIIFKGPAIQKTLNSLNKINPFYSDTLTIITEENKTRVGGSDSMAIRRVVWEGAIKLGLQHPLFGTGVETFGYTYYWVRPAAHNLTSEADFLYNKAHNEYLNFLANTGFTGLATYLFLIGSILYLFLNKKTDHTDLRFPLLLGLISILITNYFGFSVVNIALFFFLYPAIYIVSTDRLSLRSSKTPLDSTLGTLATIGLALWLIIGISKSWRADIAYNKGKTNLEEATKAITLNPHEPIYFAQLGSDYALVTVQYLVPEIAKLPTTSSAEIKKQAQALLTQYINLTTENLDKAVSLNPYNLNILKTKAKAQLTLGTIDPQYNQAALKTLETIIELSPSESGNYFNIGILYQLLGNKDMAKIAYQKAIELNPGFQAAKDKLNSLK